MGLRRAETRYSVNEALSSRLTSVEREVHFLLGRRDELASRLRALQDKLLYIRKEQSLLTSARSLFQRASTIVRYRVSERFAELVTEALRYVFQRDDLRFIVNLDIKGNLPVASFSVEIAGHEVDPRGALGGSVYEIIGICLRLICLEVFGLEGPLVLDEPLRSVDEANLDSALSFVLSYCRTTGRQLFIVTHNRQIAHSADKLFEVTQVDGTSTVREVSIDVF